MSGRAGAARGGSGPRGGASRRREWRRGNASFAAGAVGGLAILLAFGFVERRAELVPIADFSGFWAGARVLLEGGDPYASTWRAETLRLGTQPPDTAVYGYPPHVAVALLPFALLPLELAAAVWTIGGMLAAALALSALLRRCVPDLPAAHALAGLALFASQPAITSFLIGQWTFWLLAALAGAAALALDRRSSAALPLLAFLAKPQLGLIAPLALALPLPARGRARYAAILGAGALVAAVVAFVIAPNWLGPWLAAVPERRVGALPRNATTFGAAVDLFGAAGLAVAAAIVVACAAALWRFRDRPVAAGAAGLAFGSAVAPYAWGYDQLLLLVPGVLAAGQLPRRAAFALLLAVCGILLLVAPLFYALAVTRGRESLSGLVPLGAFVLIAIALWRPRASEPA